MSIVETDRTSVVVYREMRFPAERIWRALTESHLIGEWLMTTTFEPVAGHRFDMRADWGRVDCEVRSIEPLRRLSYSWDAGELRSVVTWTLTSTDTGTRVRMEQVGFSAYQPRYYGGARAGWPRFLDALEQVLDRMELR